MGPELMMAIGIGSKVIGFMQTMAAGNAENAARQLEAQQYEIDARASTLKGKEEALSIQKDAWSARMGNVAKAAGYDPYSSMSFLAIDADNQDEEEFATNTSILNAQLNSERFLHNANQSRQAGKSAKRNAMFSGLGSLFKGGFQAMELAPGGSGYDFGGSTASTYYPFGPGGSGTLGGM